MTDDDKDFVDITVETPAGKSLIKSTVHHLFRDVTARKWTVAADLRAGDQLNTPGEGRALVDGAHRYAAEARTYSLTVDEIHAYYVMAGNTPVLVHNDSDDEILDRGDLAPE